MELGEVGMVVINGNIVALGCIQVCPLLPFCASLASGPGQEWEIE